MGDKNLMMEEGQPLAEAMTSEQYQKAWGRLHHAKDVLGEAKDIIFAGELGPTVKEILADGHSLLREVERVRHGLWEAKSLMAQGKHEELMDLLGRLHP